MESAFISKSLILTAVLLLLLPTLWILSTWLMSITWNKVFEKQLAYPMTANFQGYASLKVGRSSYSNCIRIAVGDDNIIVRPMALMGIFHAIGVIHRNSILGIKPIDVAGFMTGIEIKAASNGISLTLFIPRGLCRRLLASDETSKLLEDDIEGFFRLLRNRVP